jgi:flagellar motility protein MotE (MotC chaperone)
MRRYALSLMILLTLAVAARIGIALWPHHGADSARAEAALTVAPAHAGEVPKTKQQAAPATQTSTSVIGTAEASVFPGAPGQGLTPEEIEVLSNLRQMKQKLDRRAKALDAREQAAKDAETKAAARIAQLQKLEASIQDQLQQEQNIKSKKIKKLAAVYDDMKPDKAAPMIELMDMSTVVKMFARMDEKKVGKILSFMPPAKAVKISEAMTERIASLQGQ